MVSLNLLGFGFDIGGDGVGVTAYGIRCGVSVSGGLEAGVNVGFGAKVGDAGLIAEAKAGVGIGGSNGLSASAGASARGGSKKVGAAANATEKGWFACETSTDKVNAAQIRLNSTSSIYNSRSSELSDASGRLDSASHDVKRQKDFVDKAEREVTRLKRLKNEMGTKKTAATRALASLQTESTTLTLQLETDLFELELDRSDDVRTLVGSVAGKKEMIAKLERDIPNKERERELLEQQLLAAASKWSQKSQSLRVKERLMKEAEANLHACQTAYDSARRGKIEAEANYQEAKRRLSMERKDMAFIDKYA